MLHLRFLLEYAMTCGLKELDLTVGEEGYKYRFANQARTNYVARIYRPSLFYGVDRLAATGKALARRSPAMLRLGRALRRRYGQALHLLGL